MKLSGKTVLITGATGGLGESVTAAFLQANANVAAVSRHINSDVENSNYHAFAGDLTSMETAAKLTADVMAKLGRIDAAIHLVGSWAGGKHVESTDDATLDAMLTVNLRSAFNLFRAVLPRMQKQGSGRILAVGSRAVLEPQSGSAAYAASKAALTALVRNIAAENAKHSITANVLLPGTIDTPTNRKVLPNVDSSKWIDPGKMGELLVFLASDAGSIVNAAAIPLVGFDV